MKDKCWKGRRHDYVTVDERRTHLIMECTECHGRKWKERKGVGAEPKLKVPPRYAHA